MIILIGKKSVDEYVEKIRSEYEKELKNSSYLQEFKHFADMTVSLQKAVFSNGY